MQYKAVITDLDGTAVDSPTIKVASPRLAAAVAALEANGIKVCAATGRSHSFALGMLASMGLTHPAIIAGGTRIINPVSGAELWRCGLNSQQLKNIVQALKAFSYGFLWNDSTEDDYLGGGWAIDTFTDYDDTYFFEVVFVPAEEVPQLVSALAHIKDITVTVVVAQRPNTNDIHITHARATKEHAVYELEKMIQVPKEQMIGVGDGHNDLHLYNAVGYKVAMGNAVPELKAAAHEVIGTVQQDGLAEYFEKLVLEVAK